MKKRFAAVLAAVAVVGATSAFAANPFSDVDSNSWAYQAVSQLASAGVIDGYPDGTFKGETDITRYEVAQMVAKAMAHEYRANAEQQAIIGRLASEFSAELSNLGVRVDNVESKLGNVRIGGDARIEYHQDKNIQQGKNDAFPSRIRLNIKAEVSPKTTVGARIKAEYEMGRDKDEDGKDTNRVTFDRVWVRHDMGKVAVVAGRLPVVLGDCLVYDDQIDGVTAETQIGGINALVGYGYLQKSEAYDNDATMTFGQLSGDLSKNVSLAGYYASLKEVEIAKVNVKEADIAGVSVNTQFDKVWVGGEYAKIVKADNGIDKDQAWTAGIGYGNFDMAEPGTYGLKLQYLNAEKTSPAFASSLDFTSVKNYKGWLASADYALAENLGLTAMYNFSGEDQDGNDLKDMYIIQLNYEF